MTRTVLTRTVLTRTVLTRTVLTRTVLTRTVLTRPGRRSRRYGWLSSAARWGAGRKLSAEQRTPDPTAQESDQLLMVRSSSRSARCRPDMGKFLAPVRGSGVSTVVLEHRNRSLSMLTGSGPPNVCATCGACCVVGALLERGCCLESPTSVDAGPGVCVTAGAGTVWREGHAGVPIRS
ncbi:hypothetical protein [Dactylosporangium sp. NPDC051541]|uniref:hypothetical protein n=1 Tax=Dactylosporangium sp. NPDC051541 TaxID=3363977 RepID=UPI00378CF62F